MQFIKFLACPVLVFALTGCGSAHKLQTIDPGVTGHTRLSFLKDSQTTKKEVLLNLGTLSVQFEEGRILTYRLDGTCQQVRDTRVENLSSRRRLSWRVDPHLVRRSGDSSLWVDEPLGMPGAGLIENMLAPLDDSVGLAMMNHGRR